LSVIALDLGSTRIKAARIDPGGALTDIAAVDAPALTREGLRCEFDARELERRARELLASLEPRRGERLALAAQRSSFLLWQAADGLALTPAISWQDRRAASWVARHAPLERLARESAGLPLSAHYVGPKLAALFEERPELARRAAAGELRLGTLDTWLLWCWSKAKLHATDESMAARTLLYDARAAAWSETLCASFGVAPTLLPCVLPSAGRAHELELGLALCASAADQSAGALHAVGTAESGVLVNFGTGCFVLAPCGSRWPRDPRYLASLLCSLPSAGGARERFHALEGTVNAGAALLAAHPRRGEPGPELPADAFALVDENGIGAPHWRPELAPQWSASAAGLDAAGRARVAEQGLCFRVREILDDLGGGARRCVVAGGVLNDAGFAQRLADALGRSIEVCLEPEATLLGAAALAHGAPPPQGAALTRTVHPTPAQRALEARYRAWRVWLDTALKR